MPISILHEETLNMLNSQTKQVEVLDASGRRVGYFVPEVWVAEAFPDHLSDIEYRKMLDDPNTKWYTAEEVMDRLRSLTKDQ